MDVSDHKSQKTSGEKSISYGKPYKTIHFLAYFTLQGTLFIVQIEYHEDHVRWIYLTTVLKMGESQNYARMTFLLHVKKSVIVGTGEKILWTKLWSFIRYNYLLKLT